MLSTGVFQIVLAGLDETCANKVHNCWLKESEAAESTAFVRTLQNHLIQIKQLCVCVCVCVCVFLCVCFLVCVFSL